MNEEVLIFYIKDSSEKTYRVAFWKEKKSSDIHSRCDCPTGKKMQYCKHICQILEEDLTNIDEKLTENVTEKLEILYNWFKDSDIGEFFTEFSMVKTGERISKIINSMKFGWEDKYEKIELDDFLELIDYSVIVLSYENENHIFNEHRDYFGTYIGKRTKFKDYGLKKLKNCNYTKSEYLETCYKLYKQVNIKEYNQRMKDIMK